MIWIRRWRPCWCCCRAAACACACACACAGAGVDARWVGAAPDTVRPSDECCSSACCKTKSRRPLEEIRVGSRHDGQACVLRLQLARGLRLPSGPGPERDPACVTTERENPKERREEKKVSGALRGRPSRAALTGQGRWRHPRWDDGSKLGCCVCWSRKSSLCPLSQGHLGATTS